jgi:hypothetical protein
MFAPMMIAGHICMSTKHALSTVLSSIIGDLAYLFHEILYRYDLQVALFVLLGIILAGVALGYWIVRRFVISKEYGSVDVGVAQFVKWAMRVIGTTFILQVCICVTTK